jgi:hypothetical protein
MSRSAPVAPVPAGQALQPEPVVTQGLGALLVSLRLGGHADAVQLAHRPAVAGAAKLGTSGIRRGRSDRTRCGDAEGPTGVPRGRPPLEQEAGDRGCPLGLSGLRPIATSAATNTSPVHGGHLLSAGNVLVKVIVDKHIPAEDREAVRAALPILTPDDFSVAARRIRQAAASEKEDTR